MKIIILTLMLSLSVSAKEKHEHREHGAHAHGAGTLGIAFEAVKGIVEFKIPSESIMGFEHAAKSEKDKKKKESALTKLENKFSEMLVFDSSLNCKFAKDKIEVVAESDKHSEVLAVFSVNCDKSPIGSDLTFNFQGPFPKIKDLDVQVIFDNLQKSIEVEKNGTKLMLK